MKQLIFILILFTFYSCRETEVNSTKALESKPSSNIRSASSFFDIPKTKVLVIGTFHFEYPNLDALKVEDRDKIDVLSAPRQKEMDELIRYLQKFQPTKIGIEAHSDRFTKDLKNYTLGNLKLERDERHQIALKLAHASKLDTLYPLDAYAFLQDLQESNPDIVQSLWKDYDWKSDDLTDSLKRKWFDYNTELIKTTSLLDYLKHINSKESHEYGYGTYLTGDFKLGDSQGADNLSTYWYNRNLRIFRKIQDMTESADDRIVIVMGNGHAALLRQFLSCSPEYEFVEFGSL